MKLIKMYKNTGLIPLILYQILLLGVALYLSSGIYSDNALLIHIIFLPYQIFIYLLFVSVSWDVYLFEEGIGFKNEIKIFGINKYKYLFTELDKINVKIKHRGGPSLSIFKNGKRKVFQSVGKNRTIEILNYLKKSNINVYEIGLYDRND